MAAADAINATAGVVTVMVSYLVMTVAAAYAWLGALLWTMSWPPWRRMAIAFAPMSPAPPMTTIFIV